MLKTVLKGRIYSQKCELSITLNHGIKACY